MHITRSVTTVPKIFFKSRYSTNCPLMRSEETVPGARRIAIPDTGYIYDITEFRDQQPTTPFLLYLILTFYSWESVSRLSRIQLQRLQIYFKSYSAKATCRCGREATVLGARLIANSDARFIYDVPGIHNQLPRLPFLLFLVINFHSCQTVCYISHGQSQRLQTYYKS